MKNTFFWLGHVMLIMFFVGLKMTDMGWVSYVFLGVSVLLYFTGSMLRLVDSDHSLFHGEIDTKDMSAEAKKEVTGLIIWRNCHFDHVRYWSRELQAFVQVLEVHERQIWKIMSKPLNGLKPCTRPVCCIFFTMMNFSQKTKTY